MTMPFYISPEQLMRDRADYARQGINRGRAVVVAQCAAGIIFATENHSQALHKISEIYDRIGFAAVGKYNEFEALRVAGIRYADLKGYSYDRSDVMARSLANTYAQTLGTAFTTDAKPLEVDVVIAELGATAQDDELYHLSYDGSVAQEHGYVVVGGNSEAIREELATVWNPELSLADIVSVLCRVLGRSHDAEPDSPTTPVAPEHLEAALLDRSRSRRTFRRLHLPVDAAL